MSRRPRNPELPAQPRQSFPLALRADHKLNALLPHACRPPWHGRPSRPDTLTPSVKNLLATGVKDVMAPHSTLRPISAKSIVSASVAAADRRGRFCLSLGLPTTPKIHSAHHFSSGTI